MLEIPVFTLYGNTAPFPDVVHYETFLARAPKYQWRITPHRHSNMAQFFVVTEGQISAKIDGTAQVLHSGSFLFLPAQTVHEFDIEPQTDGTVMSFPNSILGSIGPTSPDLAQALSQVLTGKMTLQLDLLSQALAEATASTQPFRQQVAVGLAHSLLSALAGLAPKGQVSQAHDRLAKLDRLIAEHQGKGWGATDYAAALCISTGHLSRLCRDAKGISASTYIERAVMEEACRMLAFTRMPVAEIGYRLGYGTPSYFSKRFKYVRCQTPLEYRRQFAD